MHIIAIVFLLAMSPQVGLALQLVPVAAEVVKISARFGDPLPMTDAQTHSRHGRGF